CRWWCGATVVVATATVAVAAIEGGGDLDGGINGEVWSLSGASGGGVLAVGGLYWPMTAAYGGVAIVEFGDSARQRW
ncbi:hypothetical protein Tco_1338116, partial [Tanacetum coccineum]